MRIFWGIQRFIQCSMFARLIYIYLFAFFFFEYCFPFFSFLHFISLQNMQKQVVDCLLQGIQPNLHRQRTVKYFISSFWQSRKKFNNLKKNKEKKNVKNNIRKCQGYHQWCCYKEGTSLYSTKAFLNKSYNKYVRME